MPIDEQHIKDEIEKIRQRREAFAENARQQLAAFDGAIAALEALLREDDDGQRDDR